MSIPDTTHDQNHSQCPGWCDPRTHITHSAEDFEHRTVGLSWKPVAADTLLTIGVCQLENTGPFPSTSNLMIRLRIVDTESVRMDGSEIASETDLDAADAEMLAAALVCEANRLRAMKQRVTR